VFENQKRWREHFPKLGYGNDHEGDLDDRKYPKSAHTSQSYDYKARQSGNQAANESENLKRDIEIKARRSEIASQR